MPSPSARSILAVAASAAALTLTGCVENDYAVDGCSAGDAPPVPNFWAGEGVTDVTFLAFGDSQVYLSGDGSNDDGTRKNDKHVQALNVADSLSWNALGVNAPVANIRGVLMAGDIVQNGRDARSRDSNEYAVFVDNYGLCGNRVLRFPIFEGYGNHDYQSWFNALYLEEHPIADSVSVRNPYRVGLERVAPGTDGHYSWDWDGVHFINVNLAASDTDPQVPDYPPGIRHPRNALSFLASDLAATPGDQPVVIMQHYAPGNSTFEWDSAQIEAFRQAISGHNVIAIVHGHYHNTSTSTWNGIPVFNVGSPYWDDGQSYNPDGRGHFSVIRITDDKIYAFDASWDPNAPTSIVSPDRWSRVVDLS